MHAHKLTYDSIVKCTCDVDIRRDIYTNTVLFYHHYQHFVMSGLQKMNMMNLILVLYIEKITSMLLKSSMTGNQRYLCEK